MKLVNKIAVITGGNSGIGLATAKEFTQPGARVVIVGRNAEAVAAAALEIGGDTLGVTADVGRVADLDRGRPLRHAGREHLRRRQGRAQQPRQDTGHRDGPRRIRVNVISPGPISIPIFSKMGMDPATLEHVAAGNLAGVPLQRFGTSQEIAKSVAFLASHDASFITGQELVADGGMSQF